MSQQQPPIILHWYPASPFAQKVAWALLYKKVQFKAVVISPIEPRPLRRPLDGGYRKTPIVQIGNHVYCDSKLIFAELERRFPEPSFYPSDDASLKPLSTAINRWTNNTLFFSIVSQVPMAKLGKAFVEDRSKFSGRKINAAASSQMAPFMLQQSIRADIQALQELVVAQQSASKPRDNPWVLGTPSPSAADFDVALVVWFLKSLVGVDWLQKHVPVLGEHLKQFLRVVDIGRLKQIEEIAAEEALQLAKEGSWRLEEKHTTSNTTADDQQPLLKLGQPVSVSPTDSGTDPATGILVHSTMDETVIEHKHDEYGFVSYTHFPVVGFIVLPQAKL